MAKPRGIGDQAGEVTARGRRWHWICRWCEADGWTGLEEDAHALLRLHVARDHPQCSWGTGARPSDG